MSKPMDATGAYLFGYRDAFMGHGIRDKLFRPYHKEYCEGYQDAQGDIKLTDTWEPEEEVNSMITNAGYRHPLDNEPPF